MYIKNRISEYDIRQANVSVLYSLKILNEREYKEYLEMDKYKRNVKIGLLIKERPEIYRILQDNFAKYIDLFIVNNKLDMTNNVLEINKDAIWVIGRMPEITKFENDIIEFVCKQTFTSMYSCKVKRGVDFQFFYNSITEDYNIRNFSSKNDSLLDCIIDIMKDYEYDDIDSVYNKLHFLKMKKIEGVNYNIPLIEGIKNNDILNKMIKDLL